MPTVRLIPGESFGRYRIAAELGRGGQAVVYRATQIDLDRQVALKVFDSGHLSKPGALERFRREAIASGRLEHPRIVTVYDAGEVDGRAYIAMRLVPGDTLAARIARAGALAPDHAVAVLRDIADAVDFAHRNGTVHRDLTPGNILLDPAGGAVLSDFGLVRMDDMPGLTRRGDWLGTAEYVSPEQVEGEPADAASDRYALAVVAFETLTGRAPFVHREPSAVLLAHVRDEPPRASAVAPGLLAGVDGVLARGLAKAPADRPASARALVDELAHALGVATTGARPESDAPTRPAAIAAAAAAPAAMAVAADAEAAPPARGADPWAAALARFAGGADGADGEASPDRSVTMVPGAGPERTTEAFGGRSPRRPIAIGRDVAAAVGVAAVLLLGGSLVGGWVWGSASADTSGAQERGYAEGRKVGLDQGFARGRAQGVKAGRAAGRKSGLAEGREQGRRSGLATGREQGREQGREEGLAEGRAQGVAEGRASALGGLSPGGWYVVFVGSDASGAQIGTSTPVTPDSGECYTVSGGTVFSGTCDGGGGGD